MNAKDFLSLFQELTPDVQARVLKTIGAERPRPERFLVTFQLYPDHRLHGGKPTEPRTVILDRSPVEWLESKAWACSSWTKCVILNVHPFHGREHISSDSNEWGNSDDG